MANTAQATLKLLFIETTTANELAADKDVQHKLNELVSLTSGTSPAVTKVYAQALSLSAGAYTADLTALTDATGASLDLSGLKVQFIAVKNAPTSGAANTGTLNVVKGATNGYNWLGDVASECTLPIGGWLCAYLPEGTPDVANGSADTIDFSSADTDADFILMIAAG